MGFHLDLSSSAHQGASALRAWTLTTRYENIVKCGAERYIGIERGVGAQSEIVCGFGNSSSKNAVSFRDDVFV